MSDVLAPGHVGVPSSLTLGDSSHHFPFFAAALLSEPAPQLLFRFMGSHWPLLSQSSFVFEELPQESLLAPQPAELSLLACWPQDFESGQDDVFSSFAAEPLQLLFHDLGVSSSDFAGVYKDQSPILPCVQDSAGEK